MRSENEFSGRIEDVERCRDIAAFSDRAEKVSVMLAQGSDWPIWRDDEEALSCRLKLGCVWERRELPSVPLFDSTAL